MATQKITEKCEYVGSVDWQRRLFDSLIPLPDGTSYNAYLIKGSEKIALIDTVDPTKSDELLRNLDQVGVRRIDYVICNHAEQDHSGSIPIVLEKYPHAKVVTNEKCKSMLGDLLGIKGEKVTVISDGEMLSLGDVTLQFMIAPLVHWPETMFTYLVEEKILFPCDFLGAHLATSKLLVKDLSTFYDSAKRYYAEIMMPFRPSILKHLNRIEKIDLRIVAPSHGPIHLEPKSIISAYKEWASPEVKNQVVIPYVSMHGSTQKMVDHLIDALRRRAIEVLPFDLAVTDIGKLAMALVDAATIVIAAPTVLSGPHPLAAYSAVLINALRPKTRLLGLIGSFGWGSRMVEILKNLISNLNIEALEPVMVKGYPREDDLRAIEALADQIMDKHRQFGLSS